MVVSAPGCQEAKTQQMGNLCLIRELICILQWESPAALLNSETQIFKTLAGKSTGLAHGILAHYL